MHWERKWNHVVHLRRVFCVFFFLCFFFYEINKFWLIAKQKYSLQLKIWCFNTGIKNSGNEPTTFPVTHREWTQKHEYPSLKCPIAFLKILNLLIQSDKNWKWTQRWINTSLGSTNVACCVGVNNTISSFVHDILTYRIYNRCMIHTWSADNEIMQQRL